MAPLGVARAIITMGGDLGVYQLIQSQTVSGVSAINFTSIKESQYGTHVVFYQLDNATDNAIASIRLFESGTLEDQGVYKEHWYEVVADGSSENSGAQTSTASTSRNHIRVGENQGNASLEFSTGYFYIYNAGNSSFHTTVNGQNHSLGTGNEVIQGFGGGVLPQASTVDGFRVFDSNNGGNYTGTVSLYGLEQ